MCYYIYFVRSEVQDYTEYKKLVSLVMSYSFTDADDDEVISSTMMVPFVDLLNHSSQHHAELTFTDSALRLMVVRDIDKVTVKLQLLSVVQ